MLSFFSNREIKYIYIHFQVYISNKNYYLQGSIRKLYKHDRVALSALTSKITLH